MAPPPLDTNTAPQDEPAADEALSQETLDRIAAAEIFDGFDVLVRDVAFELMIGDDLEVLREVAKHDDPRMQIWELRRIDAEKLFGVPFDLPQPAPETDINRAYREKERQRIAQPMTGGAIVPTAESDTLSPDVEAEVERVKAVLSGQVAVAQLSAWKRSPEEQAAMRAASTPVAAPKAPWTPGSESVLPVPTTPAAPASPLAPGQWAVATPQSDSAAKAPAKKKEFEPAGERIVIGTADPYYNAKDFVYRKHTTSGNPTLHYHRGGFYGWDGAAYQESTPQTVRTGLYEHLAECFSRDPEGKLHPVKPNKKMVDDHADALRAASHLDDATGAPAWLEHVPDLPADEMLSCQNGLLHLPTQCLVPHTPTFYTHNALPFSYEANPPEPVQWFRFLSELWPDDPQSINSLQEMFGLCLTDDTRFQKSFLVKGPKRSGKGTVGRVLRALIGAVNVAGPTLAQLGGEFGLQPLIGKRVAIISDARLGAKADHAVIAERLLSITGEDAIDINRKNRTFWHGHLKVRFIILTNELPRFTDTSGALAGRFIVLRIVPSFYGSEDLGLTDRLLTELPGILLWAIAGWRRLIERGHFVQPDSAKEDVRIMEDLGSPVGSFLRDRCKIEAGWRVLPADLYRAWCGWCDGHGRKPGTLESFGRDLRTALPGLKVTSLREDDGRTRYYEGIKIV